MKGSHQNVSSEWVVKLRAMSDETRLMILHELIKHELSVSQIADVLKIKIYNISKHMKILEISGIVSQRKEGNSRLYKIANDARTYKSGDTYVLDLGCCRFNFS